MVHVSGCVDVAHMGGDRKIARASRQALSPTCPPQVFSQQKPQSWWSNISFLRVQHVSGHQGGWKKSPLKSCELCVFGLVGFGRVRYMSLIFQFPKYLELGVDRYLIYQQLGACSKWVYHVISWAPTTRILRDSNPYFFCLTTYIFRGFGVQSLLP